MVQLAAKPYNSNPTRLFWANLIYCLLTFYLVICKVCTKFISYFVSFLKNYTTFWLYFVGSDTLELEVARTSDVFTAGNIINPVLSGTLLRLSSSSSKHRGTWIPRHFVLKQDHCLYFYKTETVSYPLIESDILWLAVHFEDLYI